MELDWPFHTTMSPTKCPVKVSANIPLHLMYSLKKKQSAMQTIQLNKNVKVIEMLSKQVSKQSKWIYKIMKNDWQWKDYLTFPLNQ